jgi:phytoene dehydrogenase-like protein
MYRLAPEDGPVIDRLIRAIKKFGTFELPFEKTPDTFTLTDYVEFIGKHLPLAYFSLKWRSKTIKNFGRKFKNPDMQIMFQRIFPEHEYFSIMSLIAPLAWMNAKNTGYPMGGANSIISLCVERYKALGGVIENKKEVCTIHVEKSCAKNVTCTDGSSYDADIIVSAADLHTTLFKILDSQYLDAKTKKRFSNLRPFSAIVQVSLGIKRLFTEESEKFHTALTEELTFGNHSSRHMLVKICHFDPSFAPEGCTAVLVQLRNEESDYWQALRHNDIDKYNSEKERIAKIVIDSLESRFGNIKENVEVVDVATPATFIRYTNLWKGAQQGWAPTPQAVGRLQKKTLPKVKNFYLTGQWLSAGGGIPAVVSTSRQAVQLICKADKKKFKTHPA